jgi:hypothetical protein
MPAASTEPIEVPLASPNPSPALLLVVQSRSEALRADQSQAAIRRHPVAAFGRV